MEDLQIARILRLFHSSEPQSAWEEFLRLYSPLIRRVVLMFEKDEDHAADCFLFVCEQLCRSRFKRILRYQINGPARFTTWLHAVVRNLCLDWHRKEFGRHRISQSIARLSTIDQAIFRCSYDQGMSSEEIFVSLRLRNPHLTREMVEGSLERIRNSLTHRQLWLLSLRMNGMHGCEAQGGHSELSYQIPAPDPDPESLASLEERRGALRRAVARLPGDDRLLLRLRFEQELTLQQVADIMRLGDTQRVDRRIREVLERLRKEMS